jgi:DNA-binding transcriptional LysR family regulator
MIGAVKLGLPDLSKAFDAGLLKTVEALLRAGQFNRVANLVAASEPLATFALARMRDIVGDPLLVARDGGLQLTRRAQRLAAPFRDLLERIGEVLAGRDVFDPAFCDQTFRLAASDYASFTVGPALVRALAEAAPRAALSFESFEPAVARRSLERGEIDLVVATPLRGGAGGLRTETLFAERFACIAARNHPRVAKRLTATAYAAERHVVIRAAASAARADPALADPGRKRRAGATVAHFLLVPAIVAESELIATLPERVAERFAVQYPLVVHRSPVRPAGFTLALTWSARSEDEPAQRWLREVVAAAAAET